MIHVRWYCEAQKAREHQVCRLAKYKDPIDTGQSGIQPASADSVVICDSVIRFNSLRSRKKQLPDIRQVIYRDEETKREYIFLANHFHLSAQTIADIYKQRWQVELFFKWIKQNLKIKSFLGNSKNAVMTQIWIAMCVYLLLAFIKFSNKVHASLQQILRLLSLNLFTKRDLITLITNRRLKILITCKELCGDR